MSELETVPNQIVASKPHIFAVYMGYYFQGLSLTRSIKQWFPKGNSTFFRWKADQPEFFELVQLEAQVAAEAARREAMAAHISLSVAAQLQVDQEITDAAVDIAKRVLEVAKDGGDREVVGAARLVSQWAKEGMLIPRGDLERFEEEMEEGMAYDPHSPMDLASLTLPAGSTVTIETPDVIDGQATPAPDSPGGSE